LWIPTLTPFPQDVANHQIRTFRILLIENTVPFLQKRYLKLIAEGEKETRPAAEWFTDLQRQTALTRLDASRDDDRANLTILLGGMCKSLLSFQAVPLPSTFDDEKGRIRQLRSDVQDLIYLDVCCSVLRALLNYQRQNVQTYNVLKTRLWYIMEEMDDPADGSNRWTRSVDSIALEIARAKSIIAPDRGPICTRSIHEAEVLVREHFTQSTRVFEEISLSIIRTLEDEATGVAIQYLRMSPLEISESQRGPSCPQRASGNQPYPDVQSSARRLAHVGVLHWWVWGPLVYLRNSGTDGWGEVRSPARCRENDFRMEG